MAQEGIQRVCRGATEKRGMEDLSLGTKASISKSASK